MSSNKVFDITTILSARAEGRDLIEEPSALGGILVDDETIKLVADLETTADIGFDGNIKAAIAVLLQVMKNARAEGEDDFAAGRDWLDGWIELDQQLIA